MNIVKLTCPADWNKESGFTSGFHMQTPELSGIWGDYKFLVNSPIDECDYWIVYGFLEKPETVKVRKSTVLHFTEEVGIKTWNDDFMAQFDVVFGSQNNVNHPYYIHDHYVCSWHVKKSFDQLIAIPHQHKTKLLSIIASNTINTLGHKKRYNFVKAIKNYFANRVDWFGKGNNFIDDKWDGLYDYKFSVAIENQQIENYWTEKLADCWLAYTIPFYYGCVNLDKFFPKGSYIKIDIDDINGSIKLIEEVMNSDYYEKNFNALLEARELILNKYQYMPKITQWLNKIDERKCHSQVVTLQPEYAFIKSSLFTKLKNRIKSNF
jgi:hypothetical protein